MEVKSPAEDEKKKECLCSIKDRSVRIAGRNNAAAGKGKKGRPKKTRGQVLQLGGFWGETHMEETGWLCNLRKNERRRGEAKKDVETLHSAWGLRNAMVI